MEMDSKRIGILKKVNITHYVVIVLVALIFVQWLMPYFKYDPRAGKKNDKYKQNSMWGEIFFNYNFEQLEGVMSDTLNVGGEKVFKYVNLKYLGAPVLMMVLGIITLCTMGKKSIAANLCPLLMGAIGVKGWFFGNLIPQFCNVGISKILGGALAALLLIATIVNIVFCIQEIKSRPADYYLPSMN